ncbi:DUF726 domain-containing protein [Halorussus pelagicus]|uniref:DUF726 domain-containing protein n=1 Tax=Halorussus pelagicus TaxID=2505977 RepID=UPI000FFB4C4F|nr:DUF726 domain-containing protein [Halorussus pelagicus]
MQNTSGKRDLDGTTTGTSRRGFLKATTTAAVGAAGLSAVGGTAVADSPTTAATAPSDYPRISTRDHFDNSANLVSGETTDSYDRNGDWSALGDAPLTLFVHGWDVSEQGALDAAYECQLALEGNGYANDVAAFSWDADKGSSWDGGWSDAKTIAEKNGEKLANFVTDWNADTGRDIRLIGHSLGARVSAETLVSLLADFGASDAVTSVSLVGGAIDDQSVAQSGAYADAVRDGTMELHNYYSTNDGVLGNIYQTREFDTAVGEEGLDGTPVANYTDHDVSSVVSAHSDYYKRDVGCVPQIVAEF